MIAVILINVLISSVSNPRDVFKANHDRLIKLPNFPHINE